MNKATLIILVAFFILVVAPGVYGVGTCELGKYYYFPQGSADFSCSCTKLQEENVAGNMVWRNDTDVIQNISANSGLCRTSFFFSEYTFPSGSDYIGNVTFETTDTAWADATDIVNDTFNVSGSGVYDCIIEEVNVGNVNPGSLGVATIKVIDAKTLGSLLHAQCTMTVYDINGFPILSVMNPITGESHIKTEGGGIATFSHQLTESFWNTNQSFLLDFSCHCLNSTDDPSCWDESERTETTFKLCTVVKVFTLGAEDERTSEQLLPTVAVIIVISLIFIIIGFIMLRGIKNEDD